MIMGPFEYFEPLTIKEAVSLLGKYGEKAKVLAGGTDLVPLMKERTVRPEYVIDISRITDLNYIRFNGDRSLRIGAMTTVRSIEQSTQLQPRYGLLCQAASQLASSSIRNVATVVGNLCNAAPSADMAPALIVSSATVKLVSSAGERIIPLEDFFTGPGATVLKTDELVAEIQVPAPQPNSGGVYIKYSARGGEDLALVGVAAMVTLNTADGSCADAKIALGAVSPTPVRAHKAEEMLKGKRIVEELAVKAAQTMSVESCPIDDVRCAADYRRQMLLVYGRDAILQAMDLAAKGK